MLVFVALWYLFWNAVALAAFGLDKGRARAGMWRIPEKTLLALAALGGAAGAALGMKLFRHKTRKPLFYILVPVFLALHLVLAWNFFR